MSDTDHGSTGTTLKGDSIMGDGVGEGRLRKTSDDYKIPLALCFLGVGAVLFIFGPLFIDAQRFLILPLGLILTGFGIAFSDRGFRRFFFGR